MMTRLFLGNLRFEVTERELRDLLAAHAAIENLELILDPRTHESRGLAYFDATDADAKKLIAELDGKDFRGRKLHIEPAKPRRAAAEVARERFAR